MKTPQLYHAYKQGPAGLSKITVLKGEDCFFVALGAKPEQPDWLKEMPHKHQAEEQFYALLRQPERLTDELLLTYGFRPQEVAAQ